MKSVKIGILLSLITLLYFACSSLVTSRSASDEVESRRSFYLVSHGWHTGIVIRREDIPNGSLPESADFPDAEYLEVGWGDWDYYPAPSFNVWFAAKALLWPTASVLHVVGFSGPPESYFARSEIIAFELSQSRFERLIEYIHASFARDGAGKSAPLQPGLYGNSAFYPSHEKFHLLKTCAGWTAKALRTAGYPISPWFAVTADQVMSRARSHGEVIRPSPSGEVSKKKAKTAVRPATSEYSGDAIHNS